MADLNNRLWSAAAKTQTAWLWDFAAALLMLVERQVWSAADIRLFA